MKDFKLSVHWSFIILGILMVLYGKLTIFLCCLICVLLHEMGHSFVGKKLGYKLNMITLMPYGAMLSGKNNIKNASDEIKIAVAGPVVNAVLILISFVFILIFPILKEILSTFIKANLFTLCFNILPVFPLDGGRILNAGLSFKFGKINSLKITKIVGYVITSTVFLLFFVSFFYELNYMLGINALFLLLGLINEDTSPYYESLSCFNYGIKGNFKFKTIKLDKNTPLFVAYKQVKDQNVSGVLVINDHKVMKKISRQEITNKVLSMPLDTKICEINE